MLGFWVQRIGTIVASPETQMLQPMHSRMSSRRPSSIFLGRKGSAIEGRAALFRAEMAAARDWSNTLVVSHWGFILAATGQSVTNGQWLRCDPTLPPPEKPAPAT